VIVRTAAAIVVVSVNGIFVKKVPLVGGVRTWGAFPSDDGFDSLVWIEESGRMVAAEALYPERAVEAGRARDVIAVGYNRAAACFVGITRWGKVRLFAVKGCG
jgi:hypothetical protein